MARCTFLVITANFKKLCKFCTKLALKLPLLPLKGFSTFLGFANSTVCREIADKEYVIALSDHSDFDGLMEYVRRSKPKFVITDNFRIGHAETLAREIRKHFGISAVALPKR